MTSHKFKNSLLLTASVGIFTMMNAHAVLPAVELDKAAVSSNVNTMGEPLIPTVVPSVRAATLTTPTPVSPTSVAYPNNNSNTYPNNVASNSASLLQTKITASLVGVDGTLVPVTPQTKLVPGNVVEYHGYIINNSPERVRSMKVTMPIPANMELVAKPSPEPVYGSNNGVQFNYMPIKLNMGGVAQDAPMSYYKAVRWDIAGIGLNEVADVKYQVRVK